MKNILEETKFIMKKYGIKANKSLGQNFLINQEVVDSICEAADISKNDLIIEIGPGLGTLTNELLQKAGKVICVELDTKMISILKERFMLYSNLEIINNDVLKVDLSNIIEEEQGKNNISKVKIVANLPYYITTPIIMQLLENNLNIESITVMVQKEVAERLIAKPGNKQSGAITYTVYYYCESEKVLEVPRSSFIPEPEVTSEVIKLKVRKNSIVEPKDKKIMFNVIKSAFMQRRKTLLNALCNTKIFENKEEGKKILNELNLEENVRAEKLTLQDFASIADKMVIKNTNGKNN